MHSQVWLHGSCPTVLLWLLLARPEQEGKREGKKWINENNHHCHHPAAATCKSLCHCDTHTWRKTGQRGQARGRKQLQQPKHRLRSHSLILLLLTLSNTSDKSAPTCFICGMGFSVPDFLPQRDVTGTPCAKCSNPSLQNLSKAKRLSTNTTRY